MRNGFLWLYTMTSCNINVSGLHKCSWANVSNNFNTFNRTSRNFNRYDLEEVGAAEALLTWWAAEVVVVEEVDVVVVVRLLPLLLVLPRRLRLLDVRLLVNGGEVNGSLEGL